MVAHGDADNVRPPRTEEWLAIPPGAGKSPRPPSRRRVRSEAPGPEPKPADPQDAPATPALPPDPRGLEERLSELQVRLEAIEKRAHRAEGTARTLLDRADQVEEQVQLIEQNVAKVADSVKHLAADIRGARAAQPRASESSTPDEGERDATSEMALDGPIDVNTIDFAGLRALGLSIADSARLLASRDVRGGFDGPEELDELEGLPSDVIGTLKSHMTS
jgi:uncharacterized protein YoxC